MKEFPKLLVSDKKGNIQYIPGVQAAGMKAGVYFALEPGELIPVPSDSEMFMMPERSPVGFDPLSKRFVPIEDHIFNRKTEKCFPVSVFMSPGYTSKYNAAYSENKGAGVLPLFSYSAVAYYKGRFYAAGVRVDREKRQALEGMDIHRIKKNVAEFKKIFPENRLIRHLEVCALCYGCPAAKNFFLKRYEGPLPTSPKCNALCIGCISYQKEKSCSVTQPRIKFRPNAGEIAETAIFHINNVKDPVVSFGQGCEGEPLMVADTLIESVKMIRRSTKKGMINLNTNASRPESIEKLFVAGLDSVRVSMNSARKIFYERYYNPVDYKFKDILRSIEIAKKHNGFVSLNYLVVPGFSDSKKEMEAFLEILSEYKIDMVQWRNLNFDPMRYFNKMKVFPECRDMIGVETMINTVKKEFPHIMHGYFNPSKGRMRRHRQRTG